jgi:hypothetical protein
MAKWTVVYTKRNSFFNRQHDILEEVNGRKTVVGKYNKPTAPGSLRIYKPQFKSKPSNRFLIDITEKELTELVKDIGLLDKTGNVITTANVKNAGDNFFRHNDLYLRIENGTALLDDEVPLDKFFLACFKADPKFRFTGGKINPAMSAMVEYSVTMAGDVLDEDTVEVQDGLKAVELLLNMEYSKQVKVLNSMGVRTENPDPEMVKKLLYKKITKEKDQPNPVTGETNLALFLRLASSNTEQLSLRTIIADARKKRIIGKKDNGKYIFGDLEIGRSVEEIFNYLSDDENIDVKNDIIRALKHGKNTD